MRVSLWCVRRQVLLLDADMLAVASPDALFELDAPAGICSGELKAQALSACLR